MATYQNEYHKEIIFPESQLNLLFAHCLRKLAGNYVQDETQEKKAYGMIGGTLVGQSLLIESIMPLYKNHRNHDAEKKYIDNVLEQYAVQSETPLEKRAWVADPLETKNILKRFHQNELELIGTYHMHRISWKDDRDREKPTLLDAILAKNTDMLMFIVSVIDPSNPKVRAFYEGDPDKEIIIRSRK